MQLIGAQTRQNFQKTFGDDPLPVRRLWLRRAANAWLASSALVILTACLDGSDNSALSSQNADKTSEAMSAAVNAVQNGAGPSEGADSVAAASDEAQTFLVADQEAFNQAVKNAGPGDVVMLANGVWQDFEITFTGKGTEDAPITLVAETPGQVILSGQSNLRLSGEHLVVSGLVFKDGYTPTGEVISFRTSANDLAYHSRITNCVIDDFSKPLRHEVDSWVLIYGRHNRFDHNYLSGKRNAGVTLAVRLNTEESRENYHRIDHNYFGPREILGSNGGETLRVGTSHYSLSDSFTTVENNYFDRTNGELEVISNKSGRNQFINNTFFEARGTLTMRHGNNNLVQGNVFFGNGADHTGGIRVINAGQHIRHNYMEGLAGTRFGGALVVMNGVPNSPINRYHQVADAVIENNTLINSDNIQLGAGSDEERSAVPVDSVFQNNLIYNESGADSFTIYDDMSGIDFTNNILAEGVPSQLPGFTDQALTMVRADNGLLYAEGIDAGMPRDFEPTSKELTGPDWYPKPELRTAFGSGDTLSVSPGTNAILDAISSANDGDVIQLSAGTYVETKTIEIDKTISVKGTGAADIYFERPALFQINSGGHLRMTGLNISGRDAPDNAGNSVIRTSPYAMLQNYRLEIDNSQFSDLNINHSFNVIQTAKGTFADDITITNSAFKDISGSVLKLDKESDDYGIYNAEYLTIKDSHFENIGQELLVFYRGGTDESTFGPHFTMTGSTASNVGADRRNKSGSIMLLHGVQATVMEDNEFKDSKRLLINHTVGEPKTFIRENTFLNMPSIEVNELNSAFQNTAIIENNRMRRQ